jgi:lipopolysaccharide/colanic/teichoic acid biosynthesis glycosyltransferase
MLHANSYEKAINTNNNLHLLFASEKTNYQNNGIANKIKLNKKILYKTLLDMQNNYFINSTITIVLYNNKKYFEKFYLGYFVKNGFEIIGIEYKEENIIVTLKKIKEIKVIKEVKSPLLIKLPRTGKNGKRIYVYKLRTMQPYAQYIHDYIVKINGLNEDGTIKNDFRITCLGKFLRKYWLDELPMLINFFKADLKLIGVRPLSDTMLNQYPKEFVRIRNKYKPGLIPPYYVDSPKTFEELIASEKKYLELFTKNPIKTDLYYFYKFLVKAFLKGVRSK